MSISDLIVVMKQGVIMQIGKPQEVYDNPDNLFVAKFLGTPPINVFDAEIRGGKLMIGGEEILDVSGEKGTHRGENREVCCGIRPEGFIPDKNGSLACRFSGINVMGRDISVLATHEKCENIPIRAIVNAEDASHITEGEIRFSLKKNKVLLFEKDSEERIRF